MKVDSRYKHATSDPRIVFSENKSRIVFENGGRRTFIRIKVDGEVVPKEDPRMRCDFVLTDGDESNERYVELKGKNVAHAIEQIEHTINDFGENERGRQSFIICTRNRMPRFDSLTQRFMKRCKSKLVVCTIERTVTL